MAAVGWHLVQAEVLAGEQTLHVDESGVRLTRARHLPDELHGARQLDAPQLAVVLAGTGLDALLRNLGCRTLVVTGVSANVAIPHAVFDAVNLGYTAVVPRDAIAGVASEYTPAMIRNTLALVATVATTDEVLGCLTGTSRRT